MAIGTPIDKLDCQRARPVNALKAIVDRINFIIAKFNELTVHVAENPGGGGEGAGTFIVHGQTHMLSDIALEETPDEVYLAALTGKNVVCHLKMLAENEFGETSLISTFIVPLIRFAFTEGIYDHGYGLYLAGQTLQINHTFDENGNNFAELIVTNPE